MKRALSEGLVWTLLALSLCGSAIFAAGEQVNTFFSPGPMDSIYVVRQYNAGNGQFYGQVDVYGSDREPVRRWRIGGRGQKWISGQPWIIGLPNINLASGTDLKTTLRVGAVGPRSALYFGADSGSQSRLFRWWSPSFSLPASLARRSFTPSSYSQVVDVEVDAKGRKWILMHGFDEMSGWLESKPQAFHLIRLTRFGRPDKSFGNAGTLTGRLDKHEDWEWVRLSSLMVAPEGDVVLSGAYRTKGSQQRNGDGLFFIPVPETGKWDYMMRWLPLRNKVPPFYTNGLAGFEQVQIDPSRQHFSLLFMDHVTREDGRREFRIITGVLPKDIKIQPNGDRPGEIDLATTIVNRPSDAIFYNPNVGSTPVLHHLSPNNVRVLWADAETRDDFFNHFSFIDGDVNSHQIMLSPHRPPSSGTPSGMVTNLGVRGIGCALPIISALGF